MATSKSDNDSDAFSFEGDWRAFAPIAFTNLLLSIVTLGIYNFWARTRERQFLWSNTRFIDDRLEWTGTGLELMIGYAMAIALLAFPALFIQFGLQALVLRGYAEAAGVIGILLYLLVLALTGIAIFRALRYRLSRTFWRGIRGGSNEQGFSFGLSYLWRTVIGSLAAGLLIPWSMVSLWNKRWNVMSFGGLQFASTAKAGPIFARFLLFYLLPFLLVAALGVAAVLGMLGAGPMIAENAGQLGMAVWLVLIAAFGYFIFFVLLGMISLFYYAAYFREVVGHLTLGELEFEFTARTWDWFILALGNALLIICTLGIGYIFIGYRNWTFFIRHMRAYGEIRVDELTQSTTREPTQGEGLLDAFDVGAF